MEMANASLYDGSTGSAEAVMMAHRITRGARPFFRAGCIRNMLRSRTVARLAGDEI